MSVQVEVLEAQVNALAQTLLRLTAAVEMQGLFDPEPLRQVRWPNASFEAEAVRTMNWFCDQLDEARQSREQQS